MRVTVVGSVFGILCSIARVFFSESGRTNEESRSSAPGFIAKGFLLLNGAVASPLEFSSPLSQSFLDALPELPADGPSALFPLLHAELVARMQYFYGKGHETIGSLYAQRIAELRVLERMMGARASVRPGFSGKFSKQACDRILEASKSLMAILQKEVHWDARLFHCHDISNAMAQIGSGVGGEIDSIKEWVEDWYSLISAFCDWSLFSERFSADLSRSIDVILGLLPGIPEEN
jgi:hypothetical protein